MNITDRNTNITFRVRADTNRMLIIIAARERLTKSDFLRRIVEKLVSEELARIDNIKIG
jgi:predicted transcriptional regulator